MTWPPRLNETLEDTSLRASVADLLDALHQARQARDLARRELRKRDARIQALTHHLWQARTQIHRLATRRRRTRREASTQLCLHFETTD